MATTLNRLVAERIRAVRHGDLISDTPMTQEEFARKIGVNVSTLVNIENDRQGATLSFLYRTARALACDVTDLLPPVADAFDEEAPARHKQLEEGLGEWLDVLLEQEAEAATAGGER